MASLSFNDHNASKASPVKNNINKQVTFAPNPVTIPPAETITAVSGDTTSLSTANVKGTIQVTDTTNPSRIKNVLVSVPSGAGTPTPDHTYAKSIKNKEGRDITSSSDDSSDSEMDTTSDDVVKTLLTPNPPVLIPSCSTPVAPITQATPTANSTSKVSSNTPLVKRRGRPRKDGSAPRSAPTTPVVGVKSPRSILKVKPTLTPEVKEGITSKIRRRGRGCGTCIGCIRDDCGKCSYCLDKPKYGGPGRKKQRCALRICSQFKSAPGVKNSIHTPQAATLATVIGTVTTSEPVTVASPISTKTTSTSAETHTIPSEPPKIVPTTSKSKSTPSVSTVMATTSSTAMATSATTTTTSSTPGRSKQVERSVSLCILTSLCLLEHFHKLQQGGVSDMGTMKCVMCTRQRKRNLAKSDKFCTLRCMTMWQESNPGKNPDDAIPMDNASLPYMPPTTLIDQTLPPAIKRLQIDMALPGSICQPSNATTTTTTAPPLTEAMITSISNNITEILNSSSGSNGMKRVNKEQPTIPSKRVKETTGLAAVSTSSKPAPTTTTITTSTKTTVKPLTKRKGSDLSVDVKSWNVADVVKYFESVPECHYFASTLQDQEVDGQALLLLTSDSLVKCLGMKLGPALKIMIHVDKLKQQQMTQT